MNPTSINTRKIKFIDYIYIRSNQDIDEKSYRAVKLKHKTFARSFFSANYGTARKTNQTVDSHGLY